MGKSRPLFLYFRLFYKQLIIFQLKLPMTGIEPRSSRMGSNRAVNCATTTARKCWSPFTFVSFAAASDSLSLSLEIEKCNHPTFANNSREVSKIGAAHLVRLTGAQVLLKNGPFPATFSSFSSLQLQLTINVQYKILPMTGFELWTSGIESDRFTNWATPLPPINSLVRV